MRPGHGVDRPGPARNAVDLSAAVLPRFCRGSAAFDPALGNAARRVVFSSSLLHSEGVRVACGRVGFVFAVNERIGAMVRARTSTRVLALRRTAFSARETDAASLIAPFLHRERAKERERERERTSERERERENERERERTKERKQSQKLQKDSEPKNQRKKREHEGKRPRHRGRTRAHAIGCRRTATKRDTSAHAKRVSTRRKRTRGESTRAKPSAPRGPTYTRRRDGSGGSHGQRQPPARGAPDVQCLRHV